MSERRLATHPRLGPLPQADVVSFTFDGAPMTARAGEPVAVALLAAGVRVFRTMPHDGEARGGYCFAGRCSDCQVMVDGVPNIMGCTTPVRAGMAVQTQIGLGEWGDGATEAGR